MVNKPIKQFCLIVSALSILCTIAGSTELELYFSGSFLEIRDKFARKSIEDLKELDEQLHQKVQELDSQTQTLFTSSGGIDLIEGATSMRGVWESSDSKSFMVKLSGQFETDKIESALKSKGWVKRAKRWLRRGVMIQVEEKAVFVGRGEYKGDLTLLKFYSIPVNEQWLSVHLKKSFFEELGSRRERLSGLLSTMEEVQLDYTAGNDMELSIRFTDQEGSSTAFGVLNGVLQFVKGWAGAYEPQMKNLWQTFSYPAFARPALSREIFSHYLNKMEVMSFGSVVQARMTSCSDPHTFASKHLPAMISSLAMTVLPQLSSLRNSMSQGGFPFLPGMMKTPAGGSTPAPKTGGDCEKARKMITQALEFYNLDHMGQFQYQQVKSKLFEEGYLPENLNCDGKRVKESDLFQSGADGSVYRR